MKSTLYLAWSLILLTGIDCLLIVSILIHSKVNFTQLMSNLK